MRKKEDLWSYEQNLLLQVLPLRNHHIIILVLFPKFLVQRWMVMWAGGLMETWLMLVIQTNGFSNTGEVVLVRLSQFAIVRMSF